MRVRHREVETLERKISEFSASENRAIDEIATSQFAHPVLFISHRWEATEHPDPAGHQLEKLRALKDCFIIYDYTSFPQKPMANWRPATSKSSWTTWANSFAMLS